MRLRNPMRNTTNMGALVWAGSLIVGLVVGVGTLFSLRFGPGDIFPPLSSLRSDPLGTKVLFEALDRVGGTVVERHFRPERELRGDADAVLVILGVAPWHVAAWDGETAEALFRWVNDGGRLVVGLRAAPPEELRQDYATLAEIDKLWGGEPGRRAWHPETDAAVVRRIEEVVRRSALGRRWGFVVTPIPQFDPEAWPKARRVDGFWRGPEAMTWHSAWGFGELAAGWKESWSVGSRVVAAERVLGRGSVVLVGDSFPFTNEALFRQPMGRWLEGALGGRRRVVFLERHHGLEETTTLMTLVRRYGLHGAAAALMLWAGLFAWRNMASFVPSARNEEDAGPTRGRDAFTGLTNLLARHLDGRQVVESCIAAWEQTPAARRRAGASDRAAEARRAVARIFEKKGTSLRAFQEAGSLLTEGERSWRH